MRILVDFKLTEDLEALLIGNNVLYRPDLEIKGDRFRSSVLQSHVPDVLITRTAPPAEALEQWRQVAACHPVAVVLVSSPSEPASSQAPSLAGVVVHRVPETHLPAAVEAFILAEQISSKSLHRSSLSPWLGDAPRQPRSAGRDIALVGCGIVNLITAHYLLGAGYRVSLYERTPDPRTARSRTEFGCTHGGDDARMFSLNETRHHFNRGDVVQEGLEETFHRGLGDRGWLCCEHSSLNGNDSAWISEFANVPAWLTSILNDEIISFNRESRPLWEALQCAEPELFSGVGFVGRVLRVYSTGPQLAQAIHNETRIGSLLKVIDLATLSASCPALAAAVGAGEIAGAIEVVGFTVNIHKFSKKLLCALEQKGARFHWNHPIEGFERNGGAISGLVSTEGRVTADHYVLSPGAYGNGMLRGLQSDNKIASVIGMWLRLPNIDPALDVSLKVSRSGYAADGAAEGANIIVGTDERGQSVIHVSSGHGYVGESPNNISPAHLRDLSRAVRETAKRYFPIHFKVAEASGLLEESIKYCVRPWTPSGLGLFEVEPTQDGGAMIVTGGHNTGGFAQAPSVAQAVLAALRGEDHDMHRAYHPGRLSRFLEHGFPTGRGAPFPPTRPDAHHAGRAVADTLSE